jgi:hypothetical protein
MVPVGFNRITATGAYMSHRFSWASFKLNFRTFVRLLRLIAQNVAELFNLLTGGVTVRVVGCRAKDVSRGSPAGLEIR